MTSIILSTICALALNAASIPAQADTNDIYITSVRQFLYRYLAKGRIQRNV